jgi:hypothetical protein
MGYRKEGIAVTSFNGDPVLQAIDRGVRNGIRAAVLRHKREGQPIVVLRDGKVVEIPADEIPDLDEIGPSE